MLALLNLEPQSSSLEKKNVSSFQQLKHKLRRLLPNGVFPSISTRCWLLRAHKTLLLLLRSCVVSPTLHSLSNSARPVLSDAELLPLCSAGKETKGGVFVCVCLCSGNAHTYEKPSFYRRACHLKHDVVSALSVSSVVMSGGIFSPATRRSVLHTTFSCAAMVTLAISASVAITHTGKWRDIWLF